MSRKLDLTASQVAAICKGAARAGFVAELVIGEIVVRLVPNGTRTGGETVGNAPPETFQTLDEYFAWRDRKRAAEDRAEHVVNIPPPGPDLNHRETAVLRVLVEAKGAARSASGIPNAGPHTVNGLIDKGLVEVVGGAAFDQSSDIRATKEGLSYQDARARYYRQHPRL